MKIPELIEKLKKLPEDADIVVQIPEYWEGDISHEEPRFDTSWYDVTKQIIL